MTKSLPKKVWRSDRLHAIVHGETVYGTGKIILPEGCVGLQLIFRSKAAARAWEGKDVTLTEIEVEVLVAV